MPSFGWLVHYCLGETLYMELSHSNVSSCGSINGGAGVFHVKVDDNSLSKSLTQRGVHLFHTPVILLPQSNSVSSPGCQPAHYLLASMGRCLSLHQTHASLSIIMSKKTSMPTTHYLKSSPILSGHSS